MANTHEPPPPEPASYAPFVAVFAAALALLPLLARAFRDRDEPEAAARLGVLDIVELCVATYAASHIVVKDRVGRFIREPVIEHAEHVAEAHGGAPGTDTAHTAGAGATSAWQVLGELVRCTRCIGAWSATGLTYLRLLSPRHGRVVLHVLTAVGVNNFLQAAFTLLRQLCNRGDVGAPPASSSAPTAHAAAAGNGRRHTSAPSPRGASGAG